MNYKKYITNITGLQFFQLFRFGILFLISIVFTKTNLGTGEIGVYETFLLIAGGVSFFWISGIIQSLMSLYRKSINFGDSLGNRSPVIFNAFILLVVFSVLAGIFVFTAQSQIARFLGLSNTQLPYLKILVAYIILSGPNNLIEYIYLLNNKSGWIIRYGVFTFILQFICVTAPVVLGYDLGYGLYGLVFVNLIRFAWLLLLVFKYSKFELSFKYITEHLKSGSPLIISLLLSGSAQYIDGILVAHKFDEATFAIFRYGARELPFVILLANAFCNAMISEFSQKEILSETLKKLKAKSLKLMHILFPVSILLLISSEWLYPRVFNPNFTESAQVFNIYLLLIISRMVFPQTILIGLQKNKIILFASTVEIFINVSLSVLFINYCGIIGVAWATIIAYIIEKVILSSWLKLYQNIKPSQYIPINWILIYSSLILIIYGIVNFA
ncbi:MAG: polysaccharide biosynthesis C-terminal domain-containing protein [Bacteroidales bacterium]|nr:polysaccharide biosynthesis C-terminal domain-containing protein [Bacteroidales bacterium]